MKRYLVTGGAGFIGAAIVRRLLEKKQYVRMLDNEFRGSQTTFPQSKGLFSFIKADIRDEKAVTKACKNIDVIIHLAFINGTRHFYEKPDLVLSVGTKGMMNIIDAGIKQKVPELFVASSSEVYQKPPIIPTPEDVPYMIPSAYNPRYSYAGGKIISELLAIHNSRHFKKTVIFRPHNVYGPSMGFDHVVPEFIMRMKNLTKKTIKFPIQGTGKETRSFIYIDDFVDAIMLLLRKGKNKNIYNIGTSEEITIADLAQKIASQMGRTITIVQKPLREGSTLRRCPDITKIERLGFSPHISLDQGLKQTISLL